jgi:hypothetical protein
MFVVSYLSLLVFLLGYSKRSLLESNIVPDEKKSEAARTELETHRIRARKECIQTEVNFLTGGEKGPVLDVWQLNDALQKRRPYFLLTMPSQYRARRP